LRKAVEVASADVKTWLARKEGAAGGGTGTAATQAAPPKSVPTGGGGGAAAPMPVAPMPKGSAKPTAPAGTIPLAD
jgi:hypothetical protein